MGDGVVNYFGLAMKVRRMCRSLNCEREPKAVSCRPSPESPRPPRVCVVCGVSIEKFYGQQCLCSDACRKRRLDAKLEQHNKNRRAIYWEHMAEYRPPPRACIVCGVPFVPVDGGREICSPECRVKRHTLLAIRRNRMEKARDPEGYRRRRRKYWEPRRAKDREQTAALRVTFAIETAATKAKLLARNQIAPATRTTGAVFRRVIDAELFGARKATRGQQQRMNLLACGHIKIAKLSLARTAFRCFECESSLPVPAPRERPQRWCQQCGVAIEPDRHMGRFFCSTGCRREAERARQRQKLRDRLAAAGLKPRQWVRRNTPERIAEAALLAFQYRRRYVRKWRMTHPEKRTARRREEKRRQSLKRMIGRQLSDDLGLTLPPGVTYAGLAARVMDNLNIKTGESK